MTRRRVLGAIGAGGAAGLAGCSLSVGGNEESGPCGAVAAYVEAILNGDVDAALGYVPYQYQPGRTETAAREQLEGSAEASGALRDARVEFSCPCTGPLTESQFGAIGVDFGDNRVTDAREVRLEAEFSMGSQSRSQTIPALAVEIEDDGWYVVRSSENFGNC